MTDNELNIFKNYLEKKFHLYTDKNAYQQTSRNIVDAILELNRYTRAAQLPTMAGNNDKWLRTDGTTASWETIIFPTTITKYLKTDADLNATTQLVKDATGVASTLSLSTIEALFRGNRVQLGGGGDSTYLDFNNGWFTITNGGTFTKSSGHITNHTNYGPAFRTQQTGENTIPKSLLIGGGLISALSDTANTLEVIGQGSTNATNAFLAKNSSLTQLLKLDNDGNLYLRENRFIEFNSGYATRIQAIGPHRLEFRGSGGSGMEVVGIGNNASEEFFNFKQLGFNKFKYPLLIDTAYGTINASAQVEVNSTTRGFLSPRMTTAQFVAIASKAQGLEAYSTDGAGKLWYDGTRTTGFRYNGSAFQGYNGTSWANISISLQYWTESYNNFGGQKSSVFTATGAGANINATIKPKGLGAITASDTDGTINGGNSRGVSSVDFQTVRGVAADVASGSWSTLLGGQENRASGSMSVVGGGYINRATGEGSSILGGMWAEAYLYNQEARGSGAFSTVGDCQKSGLVAMRIGTGKNSGDNTELFLNGISTLIVPNGNNRAWNVTIRTTAVCTAVGSGSGAVGDTYTSTYTVGFKRVGGTVSLVSAATLVSSSADAGMSGALMVITAGASNNLKIEWTAPSSATGTTFRICSAIDLVEVAW